MGKSTIRHSRSGSSRPTPLMKAALARMCPLPMLHESTRMSAFCGVATKEV